MVRREFLVAAVAGLAPAAPNSRGGLAFRGARHQPDSEEIVFAGPDDIDWKKLAHTHASWAFSDPLPPEAVRQIESFWCEPCGGSDVPFSAPLEPRLEHRSYYLISPNGIGTLKLVRLKGFVRFPMRAAIPPSKPNYVGGDIAATLANRPSAPEGGFVLAADVPVRFEQIPAAEFTAARVGDQIRCTHRDGAQQLELTLPFSGYTNIKSSFTFRANDEKFCFVGWQPEVTCEAGCCQWQYTLFETTNTALRLLESCQYACDL